MITKIDFRSDTFTLPTPEMKEFMHQAPLGDDVFQEDPSVNELEEYTAQLFGMEKALFCPSGTMTNQIAIKTHTVPGNELICNSESHIYKFEGGGIALNSGVATRLIQNPKGFISAQDVLDNVNADNVHFPNTTLVSLENTTNMGGGLCYELNEIRAIKTACESHNLKLHLDGARLHNAIVATKTTEKDYGQLFDSISICLSKGLGAPVGSLLLGNQAFINQARRFRKVFGGGMRQAGIIASGGLYALKNHIPKLEQDHINAKLLADACLQNDTFESVQNVQTNIVMAFTRNDAQITVAKLAEKGILCISVAKNKIRFVTHLNITETEIEKTISILKYI